MLSLRGLLDPSGAPLPVGLSGLQYSTTRRSESNTDTSLFDQILKERLTCVDGAVCLIPLLNTNVMTSKSRSPDALVSMNDQTEWQVHPSRCNAILGSIKLNQVKLSALLHPTVATTLLKEYKATIHWGAALSEQPRDGDSAGGGVVCGVTGDLIVHLDDESILSIGHPIVEGCKDRKKTSSQGNKSTTRTFRANLYAENNSNSFNIAKPTKMFWNLLEAFESSYLLQNVHILIPPNEVDLTSIGQRIVTLIDGSPSFEVIYPSIEVSTMAHTVSEGFDAQHLIFDWDALMSPSLSDHLSENEGDMPMLSQDPETLADVHEFIEGLSLQLDAFECYDFLSRSRTNYSHVEGYLALRLNGLSDPQRIQLFLQEYINDIKRQYSPPQNDMEHFIYQRVRVPRGLLSAYRNRNRLALQKMEGNQGFCAGLKSIRVRGYEITSRDVGTKDETSGGLHQLPL